MSTSGNTVYDLVVLGAGPGGYVGAIHAAKKGAKVAIVEYRELGGTCLNRGCIPSKAMLATADVMETVRHAKEFGVNVGEISFDYETAVKRRDKIVGGLRRGLEGLIKANRIDILTGRGALDGPNQVAIQNNGETQTVRAKKVIVATGSEVARPSFFPIDNETIVTSDEAFHFKKMPESIIVIGGGAVGTEWACIFGYPGAKVTLVEMLPHLLPFGDKEMGNALAKIFKKRGIDVHVGTKVDELNVVNGKAVAKLSNGATVEAEKAMVATGRALNTANIGLEGAGVNHDRSGIIVDTQMRTSAKDVYAIGDVTGKTLLAYVASAQGIVAADNALGREAQMQYDAVPACVFTLPEVAWVGLSEDEAKKRGHRVAVGRFNFGGLGKAMASGHTDGFVKVIRDAGDDRILGIHIIGAHATDLIGEATAALHTGMTAHDLAGVMHGHPTLHEAIMEAAEDTFGMSAHVMPK